MICVPIMATDSVEAVAKMNRAAPFSDIMEIRLDVMSSFDQEKIIEAAEKPVIFTYRSKKEGGSGTDSYDLRVHHLSTAIEAGADFVDVEYSMPQIYRQKIFKAGGSSRKIISAHLLSKTPQTEILEDLLRKMAATGADIVKIVPFAKTPEDNLRVLRLIPMARKLGIEIIAFCMGDAGRISRVFSLILGGYLTFACLEAGDTSASGQIPVKDMRQLLNQLS